MKTLPGRRDAAPKIEPIDKGGWAVRLRFGHGARARFVIPLENETAAAHRAARMAELAATLAAHVSDAESRVILRKAGAQPNEAGFTEVVRVAEELCRRSPKAKAQAPRAVTFSDLASSWTSGELARRYPDHVRLKRSVEHDEQRFAVLCKTIGTVPLPEFRLAHAKAAMDALPGGLRPATRRHYGQLIAKLLKLAVYPCELIERYPLPPGFLPKIGQRPAFSYLYPAEEARLLACGGIPFLTRLLYGFLAREGLRLGEALELRWRHLDLMNGTVRLERTKTGESRAWALDEGVTRALAASRGEAQPEKLVFAGALQTGPTRAARVFREHLKLAGVERPELFERTPFRRPIRIHDLRATFITLALAGGRSETWVQDRTGHTTSLMLSKYRRQSRHASELGLGGLKPLNEALPDLQGVGSKVGSDGGPPNPPPPDSPSVPLVAPAGLEPASPCGRGILKAGSVDASDHGSEISAPAYTPGSASEHGGPPETGQGGQQTTERDPVELALATALEGAAAAGQWQVVAQLAHELEARRLARGAPEVVSLDRARAKRDGGGK